jgi:hypothetical protein
MILLMAVLQSAQPAPDIVLDIQASARRVRIERSGEASLEVRAGPNSVVDVDAPEANGSRTLRNVEVRVHAEARIADPLNPQASVEADATADSPRENPDEPETPQPD